MGVPNLPSSPAASGEPCYPRRRPPPSRRHLPPPGPAPRLPFVEHLPEGQITRAVRDTGARFREQIFTPAVTVWTFLSQVLDPDHSCRQAVARLLAFRTARGLPPCSADTGDYCKARGKLPEPALAALARTTGRRLARIIHSRGRKRHPTESKALAANTLLAAGGSRGKRQSAQLQIAARLVGNPGSGRAALRHADHLAAGLGQRRRPVLGLPQRW
jgi:hypothetical protein